LFATIRAARHPEYAAAGADGLLFDNIRTKRGRGRRCRRAARAAHLSAPTLQGPTGLAYDAPMICCWRCAATVWRYFVRAATGSKWQSRCGAGPRRSDVRRGPPPGVRPCRRPGSLTVLAVHGAVVSKVQTLKTRPGSRTAILDAATGLVYVPAAQFRAATDPHERRAPFPGRPKFWSSSRSGDCLPACDDSTKGDAMATSTRARRRESRPHLSGEIRPRRSQDAEPQARPTGTSRCLQGRVG